jgi:predicted transcriptional regulator
MARVSAEQRPPGRPPSVNEETEPMIYQLMQQGCSLREATRELGLSESAVYRYLAAHPEFKARIDVAKKLGREFIVSRLESHVIESALRDNSGELAFKVLERLDHKNYGRRDRVEMVDATEEARQRALELNVDPDAFIAMIEEDKRSRMAALKEG